MLSLMKKLICLQHCCYKAFMIIQEGQQHNRQSGIEALKNHILAARAVAKVMKTSLGSRGLDKMLVSGDGDITITNDGATIMKSMDVEHRIAKLMVELSTAQDDEVGDGTTGVIVLAGALLEQAEGLLTKGIHPTKIADGFDLACKRSLEVLDSIAERFPIEQRDQLVKTAVTSLDSKIVNKCLEHLAGIDVDAVLSVADKDLRDVNFDLIKIFGKTGGRLEDTMLVKGIVIDKTLAHSYTRAVTVFIRVSNSTVIEETKQTLHDATCVVCNLVRDDKIVYGGRSAELACSIAVSKEVDKIAGLEQCFYRASQNSGYSLILVLI